MRVILSKSGNPFLKTGITVLTIKYNPIPKKGIMIKNITAIDPPIIYAIVKEKIKLSGARTAVRIIIINAICTF